MVKFVTLLLLAFALDDCRSEEDITVEESRKTLSYLASDKMEGRKPGNPGNFIAVSFIKKEFESYGLETHLQKFTYTFRWRVGLIRWRTVEIETMNVIGVLKGTSDKHVVIGAHMDHLGVDGDGDAYNGADDNASGTTAIVELAEAFGKSDARPKDTIVFIAFNAEELGLLGSKHYVSDPLLPLDDCKLMINLDMVGRLRGTTVTAQGVNLSRSVTQLVDKLDDNYPFDVNITAAGNRSDHAPFNSSGVPVLFFHTGTHPQYHRITDDPDLINYEGLVNIAKFVKDLTVEVTK